MMSRRSPLRDSFDQRFFRCLPAPLFADERGSTAPFVALGMTMMLGMVALSVDLGMLLGARTESQRVADAAALAGAASFISEPDNQDRPRQWAIEYATKNKVHEADADVRPEDVDVLMGEKKVRVRVRNAVERGNAIPTIFARVLGWDQVDVSTVAAAQALPAGEGMCPIPLAFPDRWYDDNDDNIYDGEPDEWYEPFPGGDFPGEQDVQYTGYDLDDAAYGTLLEIKTRGGPQDGGSGNSICVADPNWRCWFQPLAINGEGPVGGGVDALRPWIRHCPNPQLYIKKGDRLYAASGSGNKQSLIHADGVDPDNYDFGDLVEEFPGVWEAGQPCPKVPVLGEDGYPMGEEECAGPGNMRVRVMPVISPDEVYGTGSDVYGVVSQMICVWIDKVAQNPSADPSTVSGSPGRRNVYVRVYDGCGGDGEGTGEFLWDLRLVE